MLKQHMFENESIKAQIIQEKQLRESAELRVAALSRELEGERHRPRETREQCSHLRARVSDRSRAPPTRDT